MISETARQELEAIEAARASGKVLCPCCCGENHKGSFLYGSKVRECSCGAVFGTCDRLIYRELVSGRWAANGEESSPELMQFVSLEYTEAGKPVYFHGWVNRETRNIVQVG